MKYAVKELEGALLDAAVAKAAGHNFRVYSEADSPIGRPLTVAWPQHHSEGYSEEFEASSDWAVGGPIIQKELITIAPAATVDGLPENSMIGARACAARIGTDAWGPGSQTGRTFLVAAMRAYVVSRFGESVELP